MGASTGARGVSMGISGEPAWGENPEGQSAFGPALIVLAFSEPLRGAVSLIRWKQSGSDHGHACEKTYHAFIAERDSAVLRE
jgi:hypothetical protein